MFEILCDVYSKMMLQTGMQLCFASVEFYDGDRCLLSFGTLILVKVLLYFVVTIYLDGHEMPLIFCHLLKLIM